MKKILSIILTLALIISLTACGSGNEDIATNTATPKTSAIPATSSSETTEVPANAEETTASSSNSNWKQFLADYEEWVDNYVVILKKYKENPTDMSILSDYSKMMAKANEWTADADKITDELASSPKDLKEYTETLARIVKKITDATIN